MARQKITEPVEEVEELPQLTESQHNYVFHIAQGKTKSDAYRLAYNAEKCTRETIWARASELSRNGKVKAWLDVLRDAGFMKIQCGRDEHVAELDRLSKAAEKAGNYGAAVQAEQLKGKVNGHYVDRYEEVPSQDPLESLRQIAEINPDLAKSLAEQSGITWKPDRESLN